MSKITNFNEDIISVIISDLAKSTPGIKSGFIKAKKICVKDQKLKIDVNLEFEENIFDIMNLALDFKNLLYLNLTSKIDTQNIEINIYID